MKTFVAHRARQKGRNYQRAAFAPRMPHAGDVAPALLLLSTNNSAMIVRVRCVCALVSIYCAAARPL